MDKVVIYSCRPHVYKNLSYKTVFFLPLIILFLKLATVKWRTNVCNNSNYANTFTVRS
jgi:hypothetical protein